MKSKITDHLAGRLGMIAASLLLVMTSMSVTDAQDDILSDLEIVGASFNSPVDPGGSVTVEVTVRNSGNSMATGSETSQSSYMIDFVLSTDTHVPADWAVFSASFEEDVLLAGGRISNTEDVFPGGDDVIYSETGVLPVDTPVGEYQLCLVIDPGNGVEELDETNNVFCQSLIVALSQPDLEIAGASFNSQVAPGGQVDVEVTARNIGTFMAMGTETSQTGFMIDFVLSTDTHVPPDFAIYDDAFGEDVLLLGGRISNTNDLEAGADETYQMPGWLPSDTPPGDYQLCLVIDPGDGVEEADETNNVYCQSLTVLDLHPDLVIGGASFSNLVEPGGQLDVEVTARNAGTATALGTETSQTGYMIDFVLSTDTDVPADWAIYDPAFSEDVLLLGGRVSNTDDLEAGAAQAYQMPGWVPSDTPPGDYQLCLVIDPGNGVDEGDETNNVHCQSLTVAELQPDLEIAEAFFSSTVEAGGLVEVEVTAFNAGTAMALGTETSQTGYMIDVVLSTDAHVPAGFSEFSDVFVEDVLLAAGRISNTNDLAAGGAQGYTESSWLPSDTPPGDYQLCMVIDPGDGVAESDETDNTYCQSLTVIEAPFNDVPTAVTELSGAGVPNSFDLAQNYPNPFNPSTNIRFSLPHEAQVVVRVYDSLGAVQGILVNEVLQAGSYTVDYHAAGMASGMYFYRIEAPGFTSTRKFTLLK